MWYNKCMNFDYEPLISVIIPVYRVEKYLRQCLDSVVNQTYKKLEIICVNDCSDDNCPKILEEFAQKDSRIKIINNKENMGLGLSRNEGLKIATGEYVHCLDSDDWLYLGGYECLVKCLNQIGKVDIIRLCYDYYYEDSKYTDYLTNLPKEITYRIINIFNTPDLIFNWVPSAWAKLIKLDFIQKNSLLYNDYKCLEDIEYSIKSVVKADSIVFINEAVMVYRANRKGSLLRKKTEFFSYILNDAEMTEQLVKDYPEQVKKYVLSYLYKHLIGLTLDAYYKRKIPFAELKRIFNRYLDYSILCDKELFRSQYNAELYKKVAKYSALHFRFSFAGRKFLKTKFPFFVKIYFSIKKRRKSAA